MDVFTERLVGIGCVGQGYPSNPPFGPSTHYPEYPFADVDAAQGNAVYAALRGLFHRMGLDVVRHGDRAWNPLRDLIRPGATVLLKPNLIRESHALRPDEWEQIVTHGSVVRAVLDYVFIALEGRGRVIVADGPQTDSDFAAICRRTGLFELVDFYRARGLEVQLLDLRRDRWFQEGDVISKRTQLPGDPAGYTTVDLGEASEFRGYRLNGHFYGADYDIAETAAFHATGRHTYILCRSVMDADVVINLPKLKTHKKTGVTLSLKNLVGINGYRNCLPHHTIGTPGEGGDEFPSGDLSHKLQSRATASFKTALARLGGTGGPWARAIKRAGQQVFGDTNEVVRSGNWQGNDTAWRMVLDLNKSLFHFDRDGQPRRKPLRYLTIVDGIVGGEGNGPVAPDAKKSGVLVVGFNPVAVDTVCATLMGFDYRRIPLLANAWRIRDLPLADFGPDAVACYSDGPAWEGSLEQLMAAPHLGFRPHFGWLGTIERGSAAALASQTAGGAA